MFVERKTQHYMMSTLHNLIKKFNVILRKIHEDYKGMHKQLKKIGEREREMRDFPCQSKYILKLQQLKCVLPPQLQMLDQYNKMKSSID